MKISTRVAIRAARVAGAFLKKRIVLPKKESYKYTDTGVDLVTDADTGSEHLIKKIISISFPDHAILSEETRRSFNPQKQSNLWIVDPLDGTIAFASGLPFYSVSICYVKNGHPVSSALYVASYNKVFWAEKGIGAFQGRVPMRVRDLAWEQSVIALDPGNARRKDALLSLAPSLSEHIRFLQITPGESGNLGLVALGRIQGLISVFPDIWDYAAGIHIAQEAGAVTSDLQGNPYSLFSDTGHVVSTPQIHKRIIEHTKGFR